jgi:hypothetical protein
MERFEGEDDRFDRVVGVAVDIGLRSECLKWLSADAERAYALRLMALFSSV